MIGVRVGPFEIVEQALLPDLGSWFLARRTGITSKEPREVLVRLPRPDSDRRDRIALKSAFETLRSLDDPRIPAPVAFYEGTGALAVAAVGGISLQVLIDRRAEVPLTPATLLDLGLELTETLIHAHQRGQFHGRLSADGVLLAPTGDIRVWGFGTADDVQADWMPPERVRGRPLNILTDQWSIAAILTGLISGRGPWSGEQPSSDAMPPTLDAVAAQWPSLGRLLTRMLDPWPERRFLDLKPVRQELLTLARRAGGSSDRHQIAAEILGSSPRPAPSRTENALSVPPPPDKPPASRRPTREARALPAEKMAVVALQLDEDEDEEVEEFPTEPIALPRECLPPARSEEQMKLIPRPVDGPADRVDPGPGLDWPAESAAPLPDAALEAGSEMADEAIVTGRSAAARDPAVAMGRAPLAPSEPSLGGHSPQPAVGIVAAEEPLVAVVVPEDAPVAAVSAEPPVTAAPRDLPVAVAPEERSDAAPAVAVAPDEPSITMAQEEPPRVASGEPTVKAGQEPPVVPAASPEPASAGEPEEPAVAAALLLSAPEDRFFSDTDSPAEKLAPTRVAVEFDGNPAATNDEEDGPTEEEGGRHGSASIEYQPTDEVLENDPAFALPTDEVADLTGIGDLPPPTDAGVEDESDPPPLPRHLMPTPRGEEGLSYAHPCGAELTKVPVPEEETVSAVDAEWDEDDEPALALPEELPQLLPPREDPTIVRVAPYFAVALVVTVLGYLAWAAVTAI